ncbi:hypothetical protein RA266_27960, partial [Pseudomonas syringae pv. tagetis]
MLVGGCVVCVVVVGVVVVVEGVVGELGEVFIGVVGVDVRYGLFAMIAGAEMVLRRPLDEKSL